MSPGRSRLPRLWYVEGTLELRVYPARAFGGCFRPNSALGLDKPRPRGSGLGRPDRRELRSSKPEEHARSDRDEHLGMARIRASKSILDGDGRMAGGISATNAAELLCEIHAAERNLSRKSRDGDSEKGLHGSLSDPEIESPNLGLPPADSQGAFVAR